MSTYYTQGVCSEKIDFIVENNIVKKVKFTGGCNGNLQAIAALVEGMPVNNVIARLKGIHCSLRPTSCADQLVKALESNK